MFLKTSIKITKLLLFVSLIYFVTQILLICHIKTGPSFLKLFISTGSMHVHSGFPLHLNPGMEKTQKERKLHLQEYCNSINHSNRLNYTRFNFYNKEKKVMYCFIPKAACTNWKRLFLIFDGNETIEGAMNLTKQEIHRRSYRRVKDLTSIEQQEVRDTYLSFLITRHPFERLVATYRNKFEQPYGQVFIWSHGRKILRMFRKNMSRTQKKGFQVTFYEFIKYIIKTGDFDPHWERMTRLCNPCQHNFTFIGEMRTLVEDSQTILSHLSGGYQFPANATDRYKERSNEVMQKYFKQLERRQIRQLYEIYREDFEAFAYEVPEFMSWLDSVGKVKVKLKDMSPK